MSHPTPLHPDADLAVVLDDLRQDVAAWGDEGMVMRVFRAGICLMLLSILDTLIDLLADFRAGRLPPVLPAYDEATSQSELSVDDSSIAPASREKSSPEAPTSRGVRAPRAVAPCADPADAPEPSSAQHIAPASRHPRSNLASPRALMRRRGLSVSRSDPDFSNSARGRPFDARLFCYDIATNHFGPHAARAPVSELLEQPLDIIEFRLRTAAVAIAAAKFLLDFAGAGLFHLLRHLHVAALVGPRRALLQWAAERIAAIIGAPVGAAMRVPGPGAAAVIAAVLLSAILAAVLRTASLITGAVLVAVVAFISLVLAAGAPELLRHLHAHRASALLKRLDRLLLGRRRLPVLALSERLS